MESQTYGGAAFCALIEGRHSSTKNWFMAGLRSMAGWLSFGCGGACSSGSSTLAASERRPLDCWHRGYDCLSKWWPSLQNMCR
eukprot:4921418-Amphidinium_carterae.1